MTRLVRVVRGAEAAVGAVVIGYVAFEIGKSLLLGLRNRFA